jgi:preprotein translocase subunit YajC
MEIFGINALALVFVLLFIVVLLMALLIVVIARQRKRRECKQMMHLKQNNIRLIKDNIGF